jgi:DNA invertase Pin-like site-specific DNA recombinase
VRSFDRRNRIRTLLSQGLPAAQIAEQVGCDPSTVHRIKKASGATKGNRAAYLVVSGKLTPREKDGLDRLVREGKAPTRASLVRKLSRAAVDYCDVSVEEEAFLKQAEVHLRALGGNFNQIAKDLSASVRQTGRADPSKKQAADMRQAKRDVQEVRAVIGAMLHNMQVRTETLKDRLALPLPEDDGDE